MMGWFGGFGGFGVSVGVDDFTGLLKGDLKGWESFVCAASRRRRLAFGVEVGDIIHRTFELGLGGFSGVFGKYHAAWEAFSIQSQSRCLSRLTSVKKVSWKLYEILRRDIPHGYVIITYCYDQPPPTGARTKL